MNKVNNLTQEYYPDILNTLSNLSNDEVFTPPEIVNKMLDLLPLSIWNDKSIKFLDPVTKSGVFLREIAKRLIIGLEDEFPILEERLDHIFKNQLYGIAITELTSLLSRRSVYCSKFPNSKYSVVQTNDVSGNIRYKKIEHTWLDRKCIYCGAQKNELNRDIKYENYAYELIHTKRIEEIFKVKFDVIIGNPPYQLNVGNINGNSSKAKAIYHQFIEQAKKLNPHYLLMITPSRWMTRSADGVPDKWIDEMLDDKRIRVIHDYLDASICFPGVEIKGGVNYFLWDRDYNGKCKYNLYDSKNNESKQNFDYLNSMNAGIVIRDLEAIEIIKKIELVSGKYYQNENLNFSSLVSPKDFFTNKVLLTSSWNGYSKNPSNDYPIKYYLNKNIHKIDYGWINYKMIPKNLKSVNHCKVYIPAAGGTGNDDLIIGKPFIGEKNSACSQTYLVIGYDPIKHNFDEVVCQNIISYINTKFFRYLVSIKKKTQNGPRGVYQFVPLQDFSEIWTDDKLFKKYNLSISEIEYIDSRIRLSEIGD